MKELRRGSGPKPDPQSPIAIVDPVICQLAQNFQKAAANLSFIAAGLRERLVQFDDLFEGKRGRLDGVHYLDKHTVLVYGQCCANGVRAER